MAENVLKYQELIRYLDNLIETGELKAGDKLPSEHRLSDMFAVSRQTVRRAIGIMEEEGKVDRIR
ncbi:MAG: GntR family transcriptional regulator, partial [Firmicutes bacterium]|nr:GntR family transcriptional regulator [Bacillota bacterium]